MRHLTIYAADAQIKFYPTTPKNPLQNNTLLLHGDMLGRSNVAKVLNIFLEQVAYSHQQAADNLEGLVAPITPTIVKKNLLPAFTRIDAAGGIILSPARHFLFILRNGFWDLPKGKVEAGETLAQTALREVKEETGIKDVEITRELITTWHIYHLKGNKKPVLKKTRWFLMHSTAEAPLVPQTEEGITGAYWLPFEDALEVLPNAYLSVVKVFEAANTAE